MPLRGYQLCFVCSLSPRLLVSSSMVLPIIPAFSSAVSFPSSVDLASASSFTSEFSRALCRRLQCWSCHVVWLSPRRLGRPIPLPTPDPQQHQHHKSLWSPQVGLQSLFIFPSYTSRSGNTLHSLSLSHSPFCSPSACQPGTLPHGKPPFLCHESITIEPVAAHRLEPFCEALMSDPMEGCEAQHYLHHPSPHSHRASQPFFQSTTAPSSHLPLSRTTSRNRLLPARTRPKHIFAEQNSFIETPELADRSYIDLQTASNNTRRCIARKTHDDATRPGLHG